MFQEFFKSRLANLIKAYLVHVFGNGSIFQVIRRNIVSGKHGIVEALGIVGWFADTEGTLAFDRVATHLRAETQDQGIATLQAVATRNRVRKGGAFTKR